MPTITALQLLADREVALQHRAAPPPPGPGQVQIAIRAVGLNHIDVWGFRGMAFAKRQYPLTVGAEAAGEVIAVGPEVTHLSPGDRIAPYAALTCGTCKACRQGRDNLCTNVAGVCGFHVDGFAQQIVNHPARLTALIPSGVTLHDAACVAVAYATVEHMLFDNARLESGETILVHAGGSGIGSIAVRIAKSIGCTVITTVGSAEKAEKAKALGADHVINYREDRFEGVVRKLTGKQGVDVVFEHVGADTWAGSLLSLRRGGRLVTCGATSGPSASINLMQLFQQQYRIIGSFGAPLSAMSRALQRIASGVRPVIDTVYPLSEFRTGLERLEHRDVFGKILVETLMLRRLALYGDRIVGRIVKWLLALLRHTDPDRASAVCGMLARTVGPWLPAHRVGRSNLAAAFPDRDAAWVEATLRLAWDNLGRVAGEYVHLGRLWDFDPEHPSERGRIETDAVPLFEMLRDDGQPCLCFAAHLGNWELPAVAAAAHGMASAVVYRMPNNKAVAQEIVRIRAPLMGRLIRTRAQAALEMAAALEAGLHLGMLVDQHFSRGVDVTFFGRRCKANPSIARLARRFDCPVVGVRVVRLPGNRFRALAEGPIILPRDDTGQVDVPAATQLITDIIERWVREHPGQYLWFHRRWR